MFKFRKNGGIYFVRVLRLQVSICMVRRPIPVPVTIVTAERVALALRAPAFADLVR